MGVSPCEGIVSPSYAVYRQLDPVLESRFLDLLVRCLPFVAEVNRYSKGVWSSRLRLYPEALLNLRLPIPSLSEQRRILSSLEMSLRAYDEVAERAKSSLGVLNERRTALITAAVSGQIDVANSIALEAAE